MPKNSSGPRNAPPAYRPQPVPKVLQQKSALTNRHGQVTITQPSLRWSPERVTGVAKMGGGPRRGPAVAGSAAGSIQLWSPALFPKSIGTVQATKKAKKKAKPKAETKAEKSWKNLLCYSKNKAELVLEQYPNTYLAVMQEFLGYHSDGIRGHCSGGSGSAQNDATKLDLRVFNTWYNANKKK